MDERKQRSLWRTILSICSLALVVLVLSACTVGGDDDDGDATEEATETVVAAEISTPAGNTASDEEGEDSTPVADSTPVEPAGVIATPEAGGGSPTPEIVVSAPPVTVATEDTDVSAQASPQSETDTSSLIGALESVVGNDDAETTDFESSTPVADVGDAETTVASCEDVAPPLDGGTEAFVTNSDVFFRDGPGTDCGPIFAEPLGEGAVVEVLSEPVAREGDDEYLWVAVSVDGTEGWLATEFIDPAE